MVLVPLGSIAAAQGPINLMRAPVTRTARNTLTYDHLEMRSTHTAPYVLAVGHGEYFQVVFEHTDPRLFDYSISAISGESPRDARQGGANTPVFGEAVHQTAVTMRHDRHIQKYTVSITAKTNGEVRVEKDKTRQESSRAKPEDLVPLYPVNFDLWVRTSEWQVGLNGGFAFSNVTSEQFFIQTDTKGTATADDDVKTVRKDGGARDAFRPDIIALANVNHTDRYHGLGAAFGVGIGENSDPRYFLGPSWVFGKNLILTAGWTGGKVRVLPAGQELDKPPIAGDNTLNTPSSRFQHGFFVGMGFTFVDRKDAFLGALSASTKSDKPATDDKADDKAKKDESKTKPNEHEEAVEQSQLVGEYETADGKGKMAVAKKDPKDGKSRILTIAVNGKTSADLEWSGTGTHYSVAGLTGSKVHFIVDDNDKVTGLTYEAGNDKYDAKKNEQK